MGTPLTNTLVRQLFEEQRPALYNFVLRRVWPSKEDAEDVMQEVALKVFSTDWREHASTSMIIAMLWTITRQRVYTFLRNNRRYREMVVKTSLDIVVSDELEGGYEETPIISKTEGHDLLLMYGMGYSMNELAKFSQVTWPTIKARLTKQYKSINE